MYVKCRLKEFIDSKGLTQMQVAGETGLSPTIIGNLFHNRFSRLDNKTVAIICRHFQVELGEMFYLSEDVDSLLGAG